MQKPIAIEILYRSPEFVKVKFPFLEIPVKMSYDFFNKRVNAGYYKFKLPKMK